MYQFQMVSYQCQVNQCQMVRLQRHVYRWLKFTDVSISHGKFKMSDISKPNGMFTIMCIVG